MFDWFKHTRRRATAAAMVHPTHSDRESGTRRTVRLGNRQLTIEGICDNDPYFQLIVDGFEDKFFQFCRRYLRDQAVAIDAGANVGITTALISQCASKGQVYAFEPAQTVFPILERNLNYNNLKNARAYNIALTNKIGCSFFHAQSAYGFLTSNSAVGHPIRTSTIDDFVGAEGIQRLDFLKIDVEGFEQSVLDGAINSIQHFKPLIFMEFNSWCLIAHSRLNPLTFAESILDQFPNVYVFDHEAPGFVRRIERAKALEFLHQNIIKNGCIDDLIFTSEPSRLLPNEE
jgi:FkbM family methyltransferase